MSTLAQTVRQHYEASIVDTSQLLAAVSRGLADIEPPLSADKLAAFDQFHVGGLATTAELARRVQPAAGALILDAGSGLGGPSRHLAQSFGCRVIGVDLSPAYVAVADLLARETGLQDRVHYRVASIADLPYEDGAFDVVWTQHVVMNLPNRDALYAEFRRVLKPEGQLAFYDPIAGDGAPGLHYPVPWAADPSTSTLLTESETRASLQRAGFDVVAFEDVSAMAAQLLAQQQSAPRAALHLGMVLGPRLTEMAQNFGRNLKEGRVRLVMGVCKAV